MKKILLFVFSFSFLLCFVGCDKIEEDQYWVYAGANGTWYDTDEEVPTVQNAFVEKYNDAEARKSDDFLTDASEVQLMGLEYTKKYEGADLESMLGFKPEEISSFYDKMEELNAYLTEKEWNES